MMFRDAYGRLYSRIVYEDVPQYEWVGEQAPERKQAGGGMRWDTPDAILASLREVAWAVVGVPHNAFLVLVILFLAFSSMTRDDSPSDEPEPTEAEEQAAAFAVATLETHAPVLHRLSALSLQKGGVTLVVPVDAKSMPSVLPCLKAFQAGVAAVHATAPRMCVWVDVSNTPGLGDAAWNPAMVGLLQVAAAHLDCTADSRGLPAPTALLGRAFALHVSRQTAAALQSAESRGERLSMETPGAVQRLLLHGTTRVSSVHLGDEDGGAARAVAWLEGLEDGMGWTAVSGGLLPALAAQFS